MSDRRTTPDPSLVDGERPARVTVPVADLCAAPDGPRDRQLLLGAPVTILGMVEDHAYVMAGDSPYVGFVPTGALGPNQAPTHRVAARLTQAYARADIKSPDQFTLSFGSRLVARSETPAFIETDHGFVPRVHVAPVTETENDPVEVALRLRGTPYLWGGNSALGIDCSGLVQIAFHACGRACPADSDQQAAAFGDALPTGTSLQRGDLVFWRGHVALAMDAQTLIHANAHHMAVTVEDADAATARIARAGDGPVTAHKRP